MKGPAADKNSDVSFLMDNRPDGLIGGRRLIAFCESYRAAPFGTSFLGPDAEVCVCVHVALSGAVLFWRRRLFTAVESVYFVVDWPIILCAIDALRAAVLPRSFFSFVYIYPARGFIDFCFMAEHHGCRSMLCICTFLALRYFVHFPIYAHTQTDTHMQVFSC